MVNDIPALAGDRERLAAVHGTVIMSCDRMSVTIGASDHELGAAFMNSFLSQRSNPGRRTGSKVPTSTMMMMLKVRGDGRGRWNMACG
jgi:hypothetical protein